MLARRVLGIGYLGSQAKNLLARGPVSDVGATGVDLDSNQRCLPLQLLRLVFGFPISPPRPAFF